jgi:hypothetical protein
MQTINSEISDETIVLFKGRLMPAEVAINLRAWQISLRKMTFFLTRDQAEKIIFDLLAIASHDKDLHARLSKALNSAPQNITLMPQIEAALHFFHRFDFVDTNDNHNDLKEKTFDIYRTASRNTLSLDFRLSIPTTEELSTHNNS